jgi:thymidylate synthase ThyX
MDRPTAISQIREACRDIARLLMKIHPAVPHLTDESTQHDSYQILHRLTVELESLKKRIGKLEREDASTEL